MNNPRHKYVLAATQLERSLWKKDLGVLVDTRLNISQYKRDMGILERLQQRATRMTKRLEHLSREVRLRAGTVQPGGQKAQGGCKEHGARWCSVPGPEVTATTWNTAGSLWTSGNTFLLWGWLTTGTDCPERSRSLPLWRYPKAAWTGPGGPDWAGRSSQVTSRGPFQPPEFCDSMKCNGKSSSRPLSKRGVLAKKSRLFQA